jgi:hypothetical protein
MMARTLLDLLKKDAHWAWTSERQLAFEHLKTALTTAPVLKIPDFTRPFEVVADASGSAIGAVLLQDGQPVAFESRVLSPAERNYPVGEQELLAVMHALRVWRCYLGGVHFSVTTDHNPNVYLPTIPQLSPRQARWSEYLQRFRFDWQYKPGRTNCADPLSRRPSVIVSAISAIRDALRSASRTSVGGEGSSSPLVSGELARQSIPTRTRGVNKKEGLLRQWTGNAPELIVKIKTAVAELPEECREEVVGLEITDGLYWHVNVDGTKNVYVPNAPGLREEVIASCHDGAYAGHFGRLKTLKFVQRGFYWPGMPEQVGTYVSTCDSCQRNKSLSGKPQGEHTPLPVAESPWVHISMDFIMRLPKTHKGHDAIMVVVDRFSKMVKFIPTVSNVSASGTARLFLDHVFRLFGMPESIVSDRDPRFTGKFFTELCHLLDVKQSFSSAFHPESDGQTERANRVLEDALRHYVAPDGKDWDEHLALAEFAVNNAFHASIQSTPFFLNYGRHPRVPGHPEFPSKVPQAQGQVRRFRELWERAKKCLQAARDRQKAYVDAHRKPVTFEVGDRVLLATKNAQPKNVLGRKLMPKWMGPFTIIEKVNPVAYRLALPEGLRWHPVFHVSLLKAYSEGGRVQPPPLPEIVNGEPEFEVEKILADRTRGTQLEFLVKWLGFAQEHNSWEPAEVILENCEELVNAYRGQTGARPMGSRAGRSTQ